MVEVRFEGVTKRYDDGTEAVIDLDLTVNDGEFLVLVGPSGCGKSTSLRMLAGLEDVTEGKILIDGNVVNDLPPGARDVGMVFQSYALYPHMTVSDNLSFGLRMQKGEARLSDSEIAIRVTEAAELLGLSEHLAKKPKELSGGQRQRCWIAMVLAQQTDLILLDEPTTFLDLKVQVELLALLSRLAHDHGRTLLLVLHDLNLAAAYADHLVMMRDGQIVISGTPSDVFTAANLKRVFDLDAHILRDPASGSPVCVPFTSATLQAAL